MARCSIVLLQQLQVEVHFPLQNLSNKYAVKIDALVNMCTLSIQNGIGFHILV